MKAELTSKPFPEQAYSYLASAESRNWWFVSRNQIIIWALKTKAEGMTNFLEVGCASGFVLSAIREAFGSLDFEASEYFEEGLVVARQRVTNCRFRRLAATAMNERAAYDCIGCFDVLEHIVADEYVLSNFSLAVRPGGILLLTVPQHPWLWSSLDDDAHHRRRYTYSDLQKKLMCAGLQVEYCTFFVILLLPLMAMQRLSKNRSTYDPDVEFKIIPLLNTAL